MDSRIRQAITFMEENLHARLSEKELAHQAGLTPQHFCVLFKAETLETPARYLNELRMARASELLADDDHSQLSIKEIAASVGCNDLSHFVRDFEKRFGLSPKRYRATRSGET
jgi:AraC family transcriptional regulator, arabinose operon regulatory protein